MRHVMAYIINDFLNALNLYSLPDKAQQGNAPQDLLKILKICTRTVKAISAMEKEDELQDQIETIKNEEYAFLNKHMTEENFAKLEIIKELLDNISKNPFLSEFFNKYSTSNDIKNFDSIYADCKDAIIQQRKEDIGAFADSLHSGVKLLGEQIEKFSQKHNIILSGHPATESQKTLQRLHELKNTLNNQKESLESIVSDYQQKPSADFLPQEMLKAKQTIGSFHATIKPSHGIQKFFENLLTVMRHAFGVKDQYEAITEETSLRRNNLWNQWIESPSHLGFEPNKTPRP